MKKQECNVRIISPHEFVKTPWKNGKGETTELAINDGGSIDDFDWRLSIASVVEDGVFSDFTGYLRNLILIEGAGLRLMHDGTTKDSLERLLDFATFDGASKTIGRLAKGSIKDFNLMTKSGKYQVELSTHLQQATVVVDEAQWIFVFGLEKTVKVSSELKELNLELANYNLLKVNLPSVRKIPQALMTVSGEKMIVIRLNPSDVRECASQ